jgi:hypothetical protein
MLRPDPRPSLRGRPQPESAYRLVPELRFRVSFGGSDDEEAMKSRQDVAWFAPCGPGGVRMAWSLVAYSCGVASIVGYQPSPYAAVSSSMRGPCPATQMTGVLPGGALSSIRAPSRV